MAFEYTKYNFRKYNCPRVFISNTFWKYFARQIPASYQNITLNKRAGADRRGSAKTPTELHPGPSSTLAFPSSTNTISAPIRMFRAQIYNMFLVGILVGFFFF